MVGAKLIYPGKELYQFPAARFLKRDKPCHRPVVFRDGDLGAPSYLLALTRSDIQLSRLGGPNRSDARDGAPTPIGRMAFSHPSIDRHPVVPSQRQASVFFVVSNSRRLRLRRARSSLVISPQTAKKP